MLEGEEVFVRVARYDLSTNGQFRLSWEFTGTSTEDRDGDGYSPTNGDCDDNDIFTYPGAPEICDGKDTNCNGQNAIQEGICTAIPVNWVVIEKNEKNGCTGLVESNRALIYCGSNCSRTPQINTNLEIDSRVIDNPATTLIETDICEFKGYTLPNGSFSTDSSYLNYTVGEQPTQTIVASFGLKRSPIFIFLPAILSANISPEEKEKK